jgi:hypothetical protein
MIETSHKHGGPYDRGSADKWYERKPEPHKYPEGTYNGERVILTDPEEIDEYWEGYHSHNDHKSDGY